MDLLGTREVIRSYLTATSSRGDSLIPHRNLKSLPMDLLGTREVIRSYLTATSSRGDSLIPHRNLESLPMDLLGTREVIRSYLSASLADAIDETLDAVRLDTDVHVTLGLRRDLARDQILAFP